MNNDLISREDLKNKLQKKCSYVEEDFDKGFNVGVQVAIEMLDNAPTVPLPDFKEGYKQAIIDGKTNFSRTQGEWLHPYKSDIACECSNCHIQMPITDYFSFCPNCGAEMKGGTRYE